ncbi:hypothetical protein J7E49_06740 [Variovorax paradoxus]|nr:hypothetical protein [Variovorax paradoxus]
MNTPHFEPNHEPVPALPHASGTVLHESSCMRSSTNINTDGLAVTALDTGHLQMSVHERVLHIRFRAFSTKRVSTRPPTALALRAGGRH